VALSVVGCGEAVGGTISKPLRWVKSHHLFRHDEYTDRGTHRTAHRSVAIGWCILCVSRCPWTHGQDMPMLQILLSVVGCGEAVGGTISKPLRWLKSHHLFRHDEFTDRGTHRTVHRSVAIGRCFLCVRRCPWTHGQDMPMLQILLSVVGCGEAVGRTISNPLRWPKSYHLFRHDEFTDCGTHRTAHRSVAIGRCFICVSRCPCTHGQDMPMLQILLSVVGCGEAVGGTISKPL
jgi:NAD-dependent dihydropyrimidine dehydrogenase PreA subunit